MTDLQRIIVVDHGDRDPEFGVSRELAELGYASVTTPLEAAEEVLAVTPAPDAFVLEIPRRVDAALRARFDDLATTLRRSHAAIPVIVIDKASVRGGGCAAVLQSAFGIAATAGPRRD